MNCDTCPLHSTHNALGTGVGAHGKDTQELAIDLYSFFKASAARTEDLRKVQAGFNLEKYMCVHYCPTRWLTLVACLKRIVQQMDVIIEMWEAFAKLGEKERPQSAAYRRIATKLAKKDELLVRLEFIIAVSKLVEEFLTYFRKREPLIHLLSLKMNELLERLLKRFIRPVFITKEGLFSVDVSSKCQLSDVNVIISEKTRRGGHNI